MTYKNEQGYKNKIGKIVVNAKGEKWICRNS